MERIKGGRIPLLMAFFVLLGGVAPVGHAGTLLLGQPMVNGGQFVFPVDLQAGDGQVSALDFRMQFDPQVFQPVSAEAGNAALAANKMVSANYVAPGEYVVVMMGLNQTAMPSGHVATIVMQRVGTEELVSSPVSIVDPTLATPDGVELPANGSSVSVPLGGKPPAEGENAAEGETDTPETPESPQAPAPAPGEAPATPGNPLRPGGRGMIAGLPTDGAATPDRATPPGETAPGTPQKKGGLQMPIVVGSETPEAGTAAQQAAAAGAKATAQRARMVANGAPTAPSGSPDAVAAVDTKIESTREENTPPPSAAQAADGGESPEGKAQEMTLVFAGVIVVLLVGAAVLLRKFSNR